MPVPVKSTIFIMLWILIYFAVLVVVSDIITVQYLKLKSKVTESIKAKKDNPVKSASS
jgi:hypothetical protein